MSRCLKSKHIPSDIQEYKFKFNNFDSLFDHKHRLPLTDMIPGIQNDKELQFKDLKEVDKQKFLLSAQKHYIAACQHILKKSCVSEKIVRHLSCLGAAERLTPSSCSDILDIARNLPIEVDLDLLKDEWLMLQQEKEELVFSKTTRIDDYWQQFFKITLNNSVKYPTVERVVKTALSLVHGSADVERAFSDSGRTLTDERNQMNERMLDSLLIVKDFIKLYDGKVHQIPITQKLISLARKACANYQQYLADEALKKNKREESKTKEKAEKEAFQIKTAQVSNEIKEKEHEMISKNEEKSLKRSASSKLFKEASKRLKEGLAKKDFAEIQVAQAILQSVDNVKGEEDALDSEVNKLNKIINKKKDTLTAYFKRKTTSTK